MNQITLNAFNNELSKLAYALPPASAMPGIASKGAGWLKKGFGAVRQGFSTMFHGSKPTINLKTGKPELTPGWKKAKTVGKFGVGAAGIGAATIGGGMLYGGMKMEPDIANSNISESQTPTTYGGRYY